MSVSDVLKFALRSGALFVPIWLGANACTKAECLRHSDCPASEYCSEGACIVRPSGVSGEGAAPSPTTPPSTPSADGAPVDAGSD